MKKLILFLAFIGLVSCAEDNCLEDRSEACAKIKVVMLDSWYACSDEEPSSIIENLTLYCEASDYCINADELEECVNAEWKCESYGVTNPYQGIKMPEECFGPLGQKGEYEE